MTPLSRALDSLHGLSVGDAFGDQFFGIQDKEERIHSHLLSPNRPWRFTDDTNMALSIVAILRARGEIDQDCLAADFGKRYDIRRKYGAAMHRTLWQIDEGRPWREVAGAMFSGSGSFGNGAAMRVAPLGAYFADDLSIVAREAVLASEITHAHPEGIAGGVAVAIGAAIACAYRKQGVTPEPMEFLSQVIEHVPTSDVRNGIHKALSLDVDCSSRHAATILGSGYDISAQDTVPFTLWCASTHLSDYEEAMWYTVGGLGDIDTNCAIVGGIVAGYVGAEGIPKVWLGSREALPKWFTE
jgi:ADP-ribosylglycohydrolase